MYKYTGLMLMGLMISTQAFATWDDNNCTNRGGVISTGRISGTFCRSTKKMNWWSANVWCQKHGGRLASLKSACPGVPQNDQESCTANLLQNISKTAGAFASHWLSDTLVLNNNEDLQAWVVQGNSAETRIALSSFSQTGYAFCE